LGGAACELARVTSPRGVGPQARLTSYQAHTLTSLQSIDGFWLHNYALFVTKLPVGVLGASGYAGRELCHLIARHPGLELAFATANDQRGSRARFGGRDVVFIASEDAPLSGAELVFSALPHGASKEWAARARDAGARVVDLSSDLRPGSGCEGIPYGLTEVMREQVRGADLVANPGCYATAVLLALAPLVERGLIAPDSTVVVNAASGVTGAGNSPKRELLFAEVAEEFRAYAVGNVHRHLAEMRATLGALSPVPAGAAHEARGAGGDFDLVFTPHLLPVARGILATIAVTVAEDAPLRGADAMQPWREAYGAEPFVELASEAPSIRDVAHRNVVKIFATSAAGVRRPTLLIHSAIDNLVKGAAGQAVQNANVMLGLDETMGLPT
jgi:N-acetyl-gamma-glutamyl-phosphate reductase